MEISLEDLEGFKAFLERSIVPGSKMKETQNDDEVLRFHRRGMVHDGVIRKHPFKQNMLICYSSWIIYELNNFFKMRGKENEAESI